MDREQQAGPDSEQRADALKERVYVTFTALAVVLALQADLGRTSAGAAARTLALTVVGTALAVLVADVVAHITVHRALPDAATLRHMVAVSGTALGVLVVPLVLLGLAGLGVLQLATALRVVSVVLIVTLVAVGYLAVRRLDLPIGKRLLVLLLEAALGIAVVSIELAVH